MTSAVVVGGGIAGISAALRLTERGVRVTLLETRKKLGGRATSFDDQRTGLTLDNCQHVVLRCCTNYADLLRRTQVDQHITWHSRQYWIEAGGRTSILAPGSLPAPFHFAGSILRAPMLSLGESLSLGRACLAILRADRARLEHQNFGAYLERLKQPHRLIDRFWSPVIVSACNMSVGTVSAAAAAHVVQDGFLSSRRASDIGVPAVPLVRLYEHVPRLLEQASPGSRILLGKGVGRIAPGRVTASDGEVFTADIVICAVPVERVASLIEPSVAATDPRFAPLANFTHSPILGVHLLFERPIMEIPHAVLVERPTQWLFRKHDDPRTIHAVVSAADEWMPLTEDEIVARVLGDIHACLPASRDLPVLAGRSVKEKRATWAPRPGIESSRPGPLGPDGPRGIILAGDYTDTGWPATMEGAARSGYAAAAAALSEPASAFLNPAGRSSRLSRLAAAW
ncbi:MAG: FAD-dependent oxidoreductase [Phycisphaerales bacterium]|nr:FAD-dependent oxidoreductase [Phycisphaerales bacterium]